MKKYPDRVVISGGRIEIMFGSGSTEFGCFWWGGQDVFVLFSCFSAFV